MNQKNVELKRNRVLINTVLVAGTTVYQNCLQALTVGTSDIGNRIGDRINMKRMLLNGRCYWSGAGVDSIRCIIFIWNEDIGASAPTDSQIFDDVLSSTTRVYGALNYDSRYPKGKRFKVLYDKHFTLSTDNQSVSFNRTIQLRGAPAQTSAGASFTTNGMGIPHILYISNAPTNVINYCVTEFTDL